MDVAEQLVESKRIQDKPKKPTARQVFGKNISVNSKMSKTYTEEQLMKMTVKQITQLIRDHNLHTNYIKGYSRLRKAELISAFLKHYKKADKTPDEEQSPKKKKGSSKPKMTAVEKSLGLDKPLYPQGLEKGAREQFEARYGKAKRLTAKQKAAAEGLRILEAQQAAEGLGRGKRKKRAPAKLRN